MSIMDSIQGPVQSAVKQVVQTVYGNQATVTKTGGGTAFSVYYGEEAFSKDELSVLALAGEVEVKKVVMPKQDDASGNEYTPTRGDQWAIGSTNYAVRDIDDDTAPLRALWTLVLVKDRPKMAVSKRG